MHTVSELCLRGKTGVNKKTRLAEQSKTKPEGPALPKVATKTQIRRKVKAAAAPKPVLAQKVRSISDLFT